MKCGRIVLQVNLYASTDEVSTDVTSYFEDGGHDVVAYATVSAGSPLARRACVMSVPDP